MRTGQGATRSRNFGRDRPSGGKIRSSDDSGEAGFFVRCTIICTHFGTNVQHDHADMPRWPKTKPEVNSFDVISRTSGTDLHCSQRFYEIFEQNLV